MNREVPCPTTTRFWAGKHRRNRSGSVPRSATQDERENGPHGPRLQHRGKDRHRFCRRMIEKQQFPNCQYADTDHVFAIGSTASQAGKDRALNLRRRPLRRTMSSGLIPKQGPGRSPQYSACRCSISVKRRILIRIRRVE